MLRDNCKRQHAKSIDSDVGGGDSVVVVVVVGSSSSPQFQYVDGADMYDGIDDDDDDDGGGGKSLGIGVKCILSIGFSRSVSGCESDGDGIKGPYPFED